MTTDIRWKQRFSNYSKALSQLKKFIDKGDLNEMEQQGLIQAFEYTYELAWNVMKDFLQEQGNQDIYGSKSAIMESFKLGLIEDGDGWMELFKDRNRSSHTYNEDTASEIVQHIFSLSYPLFVIFKNKMDSLL
ncbi:nucleotidyltransferase substrate binding protein [Dyadobacter psychrotolerans]|uniref:Nucleotidyltransferase n=1 Tax=Dyadobacter psychrotolerans TaxID=2541721 RepID=A0A4R5DKK2_9BACT|nr:nucleotidyltransferase substrate binding protein [Dyadobacter psychrotolerans]TDE12501.1 nucleotidyltransferase [Dyadobacter psychrotolerans]